jgi:nucleotide-binding universal stress UspA family protein
MLVQDVMQTRLVARLRHQRGPRRPVSEASQKGLRPKATAEERPMCERVLIPLDGSELGEAILPFAEKIAGPLDAEIVLVRVVEPLSAVEAMAAPGVVTPDTFPLREMEAKRYLTDVEKRLTGKGLRVRARIQIGSPAEEILAAAATVGADLIAMTTHGRSGLTRILFGSVAEAVLRASPVPVLMIRMIEKAGPPAG